MPQQGIWNVEWLNQNSQRNYPISEEATTKDVTGTFQLPQDLIVDLVWPVQASAAVQTERFYIHSVAIFGGGITVTLGYHVVGASEGTAIGSVSIATATHTRNQSYFISGVGDFYDSVGKITIGDVVNALNVGGYYTFDIAGSRLEPTVVRPNLRGVSAVVLVNGSDKSDPMSGDIQLVAGTNFRLVPNPNPGGNPQIRLDAIAGAGLNSECGCDGQQPTTSAPIRTINGIPPNTSGDFILIGDECLELTPTVNGIEMNDKCSKACCGCQELEVIVAEIKMLLSQVDAMDKFISKMNAQIDTTVLNIVASKTSDLPCGGGGGGSGGGGGGSGGGGGATIPPPEPVPGVPRMVFSNVLNLGTGVYVHWTRPESDIEIYGYKVYRMSSRTNGVYSLLATVDPEPFTAYTDMTASEFSTTYTYYVKSFNAAGESRASNTTSSTIGPYGSH